MKDCKREWPSFICDGCGKKAVLTYDEFVVNGEGRRLCTDCASKVLETERVFVDHVPGSVDRAHHMTRYSTWEDLESKLREERPRIADFRIGTSDVTGRSAMLLMVYKTDGEVHWWVLGTAYNIPGEPPWPHWKKVVRKLGGRA